MRMGEAERAVVGEIVASGMTVGRWCAETGAMGTTRAYRILNWFRENDPSAFGAGEEAARASGGDGAWFERVRRSVAGGQATGGGESPGRATGSFALVDASSLAGPAPAARDDAPRAITVEAMGVRVTLPAGCAAADAEAAISATLRALGVAR